jgi:hypothetical protein
MNSPFDFRASPPQVYALERFRQGKWLGTDLMSCWTSSRLDVVKNIMKAELIVRTRQNVRDDAFVEMIAWKVPTSVPGSDHDIKYRLALVADTVRALRYDNGHGKGATGMSVTARRPIASSISRLWLPIS